MLFIIKLRCGVDIHEYIKAIDPAVWILYPHIGNTRLYGWRTTNFVESENATTLKKDIRHKLPFPFLVDFINLMREDFNTKRKNTRTWVGEQRSMAPAAADLYADQLDQVGSYKCELLNDDMANVYATQVLPICRRRVSLSRRSCTCPYMDQHSVPCRHFIVALRAMGKIETVVTYFDVPYMAENSAAAFKDACVIPPIDDELSEGDLLPGCVPPTQVGRPPERRFASAGESTTNAPVRVSRCSICGRHGHNERKCPAASVGDSNAPADEEALCGGLLTSMFD